VRIRTATLADISPLADLAQRAFCETFHHYTPDDLAGFFAEHYSPEAFVSHVSEPGSQLWLAEADGTPVAYAKLGACKLPLMPAFSPAVELHRLYVLKEWHGKGIGGAMMDKAFGQALAQGAKAMYLGVWEHNVKAQSFYRRYGFSKVGEYDYPPIGSVIDREWIMVRKL
jgi:diamine N-acetyltransferase